MGTVTVDTPDGPRAIETIHVGDLVLAKNESGDGPVRARRVEAVFVREAAPTLEIDVCSASTRDTIETTDDHPFWVEGRGWLRADNLWNGAPLGRRDGVPSSICGARRTGRTMRVYNLTVEGDHTFFVVGGTWVHNTNPSGPGSCATAAASVFWSPGKKGNPAKNAQGHYQKHGGEFPEHASAGEYIQSAQNIAAHPPAGAQVAARADGDTIIYEAASNTLVIRAPNGAPRTMYRPNPDVHGYETNQQYVDSIINGTGH